MRSARVPTLDSPVAGIPIFAPRQAQRRDVYTIGEFAKLSQVPVRTLRIYDSLGLLRPAHVERRTGYRRYSATQLKRLNRILVFKDMGLSLREIRDLLAENLTLDDIRDVVWKRREELQ